jgi:hypothetical protein
MVFKWGIVMDQRFKVKRAGIFLIPLVLPIMLLACAGAPLRGGKMPDWVKEGSGAFRNAGEKVFYGVGAVVGIKNEPLARTSAENRARAEVAKIFETYSASLMKDYMASTTGGAAVTSQSPAVEEQHVEQTIKTFSAVTLSGVMIVDHWVDAENDTHYALARLDLERFKQSLDRMQELNAQAREFIRKNAEKSFDDLAREEEKHGK